MKKIALSLAALAVCSFSFTACEDVPAPYEINDIPGISQNGAVTLPYSEAFATSFGKFKNYTPTGGGEWKIDFKTAKASGWDKATQTTTAGTYYLVSPEISLEGQTEAHVAYEYILAYDKGKDNQQLMITTAFDEAKPAEGWKLLNDAHLEREDKTDWNTFRTADINIPAEYMGKKIRIAFRYNTDNVSGSTWEVKNFMVAKGQATVTPDTPQKPDAPMGKNLLTNESFENWTNNLPDAWKSTTSASSAELVQSTDAHTGSYSVVVKCVETQNKRLGSKEYTLKPGTYQISLFVKGEGQVRPGYAIVGADGKIPSQNGYVYGAYTPTKANEWTEVTHTFTLAEQTKVNFVMMNPKTSTYATASDKIVDDFTLCTSDGGLVEEGGTTPEPQQPQVGGDVLNETFANGQGQFTIEDKKLPAELSYIWNHSTYKGDAYMKASAFKGACYESESWLISPVVDLSKAKDLTLTFDHVINKGDVSKMTEENTLIVKEEGGQWTKMDIATYPSGASWSDWATSTQSLAAYKGKKIQFAFVYKSTATASSSWEVKNVVVK